MKPNPGPTPVPDFAAMDSSLSVLREGTQSLSALRMRDGTVEWGDVALYVGILGAEKGIVYVSEYEHHACVSALQATSGKRLWSTETDAHVQVGYGSVYLYQEGSVTALNAFTGLPRWTVTQSSIDVLQVFAGAVYMLDGQAR